jgi:GNAT superfamily N-acetyltransferase
VQLRLAVPDDAEAIAATLRNAFLEFEPLYTLAAFRATTPPAQQILARWSEGPTWVAIRDGRILGTVSAVPRGAELYIRSMAVHPAARGCGAGGALLQTIEDWALQQQHEQLALSTTPFLEAAIRLYRRRGFRQVGESDLFGTPLLLMSKRL